jgi:hypothetical protein
VLARAMLMKSFVTPAPPAESRGGPIHPRPTVSVGARKHVPASRIQTQIGIGENTIDHAAGVARYDRVSGAQGALPNREEDSGLFATGHWVQDEPQVVLPLRRTWIVVWTAISMALVPLAVGTMIALASKGPDDAPPDRASSRSDVVVPAPRTELAPAESAAAPPSDPTKAAPRPDEGNRSAVKQRAPRGAKERRMEVQRRAPPKGRPTGDWVPKGP